MKSPARTTIMGLFIGRDEVAVGREVEVVHDRTNKLDEFSEILTEPTGR